MTHTTKPGRSQLPYYYLPTGFFSSAEIITGTVRFGALFQLLMVRLLVAIAGAKDAEVPDEVADAIAYELRIENGKEMVAYAISSGLIHRLSTGLSAPEIIEAQEDLFLKREDWRLRQKRKREGSVTRDIQRDVPRDISKMSLTLNTQDLSFGSGFQGGPRGDSDADQQNGADRDSPDSGNSNGTWANSNDSEAAYTMGTPTSESFVKSPPSQSVQKNDSRVVGLGKYFAPAESVQNNTVFVNTGRRPMRNYPDLWLSEPELQNVLDLWQSNQVAKVAYRSLFQSAQSRALTQKAAGKDTSRIAAVNWLTSWVLQEHLKTQSESARLKKAQTPYQAPGLVQNPAARKELVPSWAGMESRKPTEEERAQAKAALEKIKALTKQVGF